MGLETRRILKSVISLALLVVFAVGLPIMGWLSNRHSSVTEIPQEEMPQEETLFQWTMKKLDAQKAVDRMLQEELERGSYTFESPLVVLDPYGESPLTALILFRTTELSKIEITIPGDSVDTGAVHVFDKMSIEHVVPVYGLYPDQINRILIRQLSGEGQVIAENTVEIQTEPLPKWLDDYIILTGSYRDDYMAGLNYMSDPQIFAFDRSGAIRWFLSDTKDQLMVMAFMPSSRHWLVTYGAAWEEGDTVILEIDLTGKIYATLYTPYGAHHDIAIMPNGNILVTGSRGCTQQNLIVEIDTETGEIVNTLDLSTVLQRMRFGAVKDWVHNNSIVWDEGDDTIIISSNTQCTVAKITWPEGEVRWLLSDPIEYMPRLQNYLLAPIGQNFEYSYNQHHATILPDYDNNPDTLDLLIFDNGQTRFTRDRELQRAIAAHEIVAPERYSRLVHYRINEKNATVEQIWQYGKERGEELYAQWRGSAQLLENKNVLGFFNKMHDPTGEIANSGNVVEVNRDGELIWDAELFSKGDRGNFLGYRAFRYPIYFSDDTELDIYAEAKNLIPQELLDQNK